MYVPEESHDGIVPMNHSNKDERPLAENEEGRPSIKGERWPTTHVPDTERGSRVTGIGGRAESSTGTQGDEVHCLAPPSDH